MEPDKGHQYWGVGVSRFGCRDFNIRGVEVSRLGCRDFTYEYIDCHFQVFGMTRL